MKSTQNSYKIYKTNGDIHVGDLAEDGFQLRPNIVWFEEPVPMINIAEEIAATADIFVVIGTSLQVYPAAVLINCTRAYIPKFIIDNDIPKVAKHINQLTVIEKTASEGVADLVKILNEIK